MKPLINAHFLYVEDPNKLHTNVIRRGIRTESTGCPKTLLAPLGWNEEKEVMVA